MEGERGSPVFRLGDLMRRGSTGALREDAPERAFRTVGTSKAPCPPLPLPAHLSGSGSFMCLFDSPFPIFGRIAHIYEGTHTCLLDSAVPRWGLCCSLFLDKEAGGVQDNSVAECTRPHNGARGTYEIIWKSL